jgi:hypothetical protein
VEPDAKVDNDIAMMMIKKRIEQNSFDDPNYTSFVGEGRVTRPLSRRASRHLRSKLSSPLTIVEGMRHPGLFGQWFSGPSWDGWEAIKKAQY